MYINNEIKFLKCRDPKTDFELLTIEVDIQYVKVILHGYNRKQTGGQFG